MRRAMAVRPANTMTNKTKYVMTKAIICVIEGALVGLAAVIAWGMLVTLFSL